MFIDINTQLISFQNLLDLANGSLKDVFSRQMSPRVT